MSLAKESQCYFVQLQIDSFLDADLTSQQQDVFMAHIHDCSACAAELQFARQLHDSVLDLPLLECPETVLEPVHRLGNSQQPANRWSALWTALEQLPMVVRYGLPAAAAVVLTLLLAPQFSEGPAGSAELASQPPQESYSQEDVVMALRDLNTAINYLNEVSERTETMVGNRFVITPLRESLNASFERIQEEDEALNNGPI
jgi:hypothetical protein